MWQSAQRRRSHAVEARDVEQAAADAAMVFLAAVCAPAYLGLTGAQQAFLRTMAPDWPAPSAVAEIARRSGKSTARAAAYRKSLIDANVIVAAGRGLVSYAIPHFGEYMEQITSTEYSPTGH